MGLAQRDCQATEHFYLWSLIVSIRGMIAGKLRTGARGRSGATLVETAVALPVFFLFVWALVEFGHAFTVSNLITAAAKRAAREGVADDVTTAQVIQMAEDIISTGISLDNVTIMVKNAAVFDVSGTNPSTINYSSLPNVELNDMEPRELFVVYIEVPYSSVCLMSPKWMTNITLRGVSAQRHE